MKRRSALQALAFGTAGLAVPAVMPRARAQSGATELTFVSYAVARPVFSQILPAFVREYEGSTGQTVRVTESYGPSGAQTRAILAGLEADIIAQNLETNVTPLVEAGLVKDDWASRLPNGASPATTVMAIIVRPGNPKNIQTWEDLARDDVEVVAINPQTGGNARWGVMAGYGSVLRANGEDAANDYLNRYVKNIVSLVGGGREATDTFIQNQVGDALVTFESEAIFVNSEIPQEFPSLVPQSNIQVDFPVAVIDEVVDRKGTRQAAEALAEFLFTPVAQQFYAITGYRPADEQILSLNTKYQPVEDVFTIAEFGGWSEVNSKIFSDGGLFDQALQAAQA